MKNSLFLLAFLGIFVNNEAFGIGKEMAAMQCKAKFRVPYSDIEKIKNRQMPETREGKCMMACILKKLKVISRDGKFQVNTVKGWIANKYKDDTKKLNRAYAKADACAAELPMLGEDECEYAVKILECSRRRKKLKVST
ncbi:general odorant-binding protein 19d [Halyomorpha halys]|uniref:general odorant-binding protein 19d n=1 Tax=Halyomorpha halys TaxID=286706 RepID=UPI0006D519CE|nr:general odorant-binding protein 19d-like [Halyomorpha halys]KAE8573017.1 Odorant-binding protein 34 [Halyomorpha halys]